MGFGRCRVIAHRGILNPDKKKVWKKAGKSALLKSAYHFCPASSNLIIMAAPGNNLYRRTPSRLEQAASLDQEIKRIEDAIRKLKIDFDIYFSGSVKRPPLEARARLESSIKRISDN